MTVDDRVLAQMRRGPIKAADFDCQPAIDGGDRHTRLAARIHSLRAKGHTISDRMVRLGNSHVKEYALVREAGAPHPSVGIAEGLRTLDVPMGGPNSVYEYDNDGEEWWAA